MSTSAGFKAFITPETATWGSLPASPTWAMLPIDPTSGVDTVETLFDDARRGLAAIGFRQLEGVHRTDFSIGGPAYPDEIGHLIRSIIGADTVGTAAPYAHVFDIQSMADAGGRSFQIQLLDDALAGGESYTHQGCVATGLTFRFNSSTGLLTYEANILGKGMVTTTAQAAVSDSTDEPLRGWHANVATSSGLGTGATGRLIEGEIAIARDAELLYVANNNKFPVKLIPGLIAVTGRFTASFDVLANLELYRALTNEALILEFAYGAGAATRSIDFEFPKASYGDSPAEIDRSGNNMTIAYNFRGLIGTSSSSWKAPVESNIRMRMRNALATAYPIGS